jgi:hypothetical protein
MSAGGDTRLRIYVASSWRNLVQPDLVSALREDGHIVYDFREPTPGGRGFSWHELDNSLPVGPADLQLAAGQIRTMLDHPTAEVGFAVDMEALETCDVCVLLLPCGRSAHLEAGWAAGAAKFVVGLLADGEPDLMWKMCDYLATDIGEVRHLLSERIELRPVNVA